MRGDPDLDIFFQTPPSEGTSEDWGQAQMIRLRTRDYQTGKSTNNLFCNGLGLGGL